MYVNIENCHNDESEGVDFNISQLKKRIIFLINIQDMITPMTC
jgi:hypothetical protein